VGPRAGARLRRCGDSDAVVAPAPAGPRHARLDGFDLHANLVVPPRDRQQLERVCRCALRPPIAQDRLHLTPDGQVVLELRHRWSDGTTHLLFDPLELLERLAALTPRPRINLVLYYGVFGPHARRRARVVAGARREPVAVASVGLARRGDGAPGACSGPAHRAPGQPCGPPGIRQPATDSVAPGVSLLTTQSGRIPVFERLGFTWTGGLGCPHVGQRPSGSRGGRPVRVRYGRSGCCARGLATLDDRGRQAARRS